MIDFKPEKKDKDGKKVALAGEDLGEIVIFDEPITEHDKVKRTTKVTGYQPRARAQILTNEEQVPRFVVVDLTEQEAAQVRAMLHAKLVPAAKLVLGMED